MALHRSEAAFAVAVALASAVALAALALGLLADPPTVAAVAALAAAVVVAAVTPRGTRLAAAVAAASTVALAGHLAPRAVFEGLVVEARGDAELAVALAVAGLALVAGVALTHAAVFAPPARRPDGPG